MMVPEQKPKVSFPSGTLPEAGPVDLSARLEFLELSSVDQERLHGIARMLKDAAPDFVEEFYRHLLRFKPTAAFLQDPALVERLKEMQRFHLESMLNAQWDEEYVARRQRVGDVHAKVGIEPHVFLGAYYQYLQFCFLHLGPARDPRISEYSGKMLSLLKAVLLDVGLTLDAYFSKATQNLQQALDIVFESNRELRQFAQFTSHDLKTPLATVANLCDEVLDEFGTAIPAEAQRLIAAARDRALRMSTTIDELLKSTISLRPHGEEEEFAVGEAIAEAVELVRPQLLEKGMEVTVPADLPWIAGDRVRIREAFYNLMANAAKFIDKRPGRIVITAKTTDVDCTICIADNGPGIPRDDWTRIFVPFGRLPEHQDIPGSGLGLYFTKSIIEQQGGEIWVESEPGKGARFYVRFRRSVAAAKRGR